ncbi:MAG: alcohol dehydrogenase class IV, partial [Paraglaciecola sp.]
MATYSILLVRKKDTLPAANLDDKRFTYRQVNMKPFIFSTTKSIISEIGAIERIAEICSTLDISKPLIITDQGIVDVGLMQPLDVAFKHAGKEYFCFDQVVADPPEHIVLSAVTYAKELEVDGIIGFGGGSSLDTA